MEPFLDQQKGRSKERMKRERNRTEQEATGESRCANYKENGCALLRKEVLGKPLERALSFSRARARGGVGQWDSCWLGLFFGHFRWPGRSTEPFPEGSFEVLFIAIAFRTAAAAMATERDCFKRYEIAFFPVWPGRGYMGLFPGDSSLDGFPAIR